jgi:hypothetical protein
MEFSKVIQHMYSDMVRLVGYDLILLGFQMQVVPLLLQDTLHPSQSQPCRSHDCARASSATSTSNGTAGALETPPTDYRYTRCISANRELFVGWICILHPRVAYI